MVFSSKRVLTVRAGGFADQGMGIAGSESISMSLILRRTDGDDKPIIFDHPSSGPWIIDPVVARLITDANGVASTRLIPSEFLPGTEYALIVPIGDEGKKGRSTFLMPDEDTAFGEGTLAVPSGPIPEVISFTGLSDTPSDISVDGQQLATSGGRLILVDAPPASASPRQWSLVGALPAGSSYTADTRTRSGISVPATFDPATLLLLDVAFTDSDHRNVFFTAEQFTTTPEVADDLTGGTEFRQVLGGTDAFILSFYRHGREVVFSYEGSGSHPAFAIATI